MDGRRYVVLYYVSHVEDPECQEPVHFLHLFVCVCLECGRFFELSWRGDKFCLSRPLIDVCNGRPCSTAVLICIYLFYHPPLTYARRAAPAYLLLPKSPFCAFAPLQLLSPYFSRRLHLLSGFVAKFRREYPPIHPFGFSWI